MPEEPLFFVRDNLSLFGVVHEPDAPSDRPPVVFCHPLGEEKLWAHRVFVTFARELASRGYAVLRFDQAGQGDSDLPFDQSSLESASADIEAAIGLMLERRKASRVSLLGLRTGASLAWRVAAARNDVDELIMWAPVVDGSRYLQELLRINLTTQMAARGEIADDREALRARLRAGATVNIDGFEMSGRLADDLDALALATSAPPRCRRALVVQLDRAPGATISREHLALQALLPSADLEVAQEEPFWKEIPRFYDRAPNLFSHTLRWLGVA